MRFVRRSAVVLAATTFITSCAGLVPDFPGEGEGEGEGQGDGDGMSWSLDGEARAGVQVNADYTRDEQNDRCAIGVSAAANGNETCLVGINFVSGATIPAGTYPCNDDVTNPPLVNIQVGLATGFYNATGSPRCEVVLDEAVSEGSPVRGSFDAVLVNISASDDTIEVAGSFDVPSSI